MLVGLGLLALPDLVTGAWAVVDPAGWYENFPGLGRHWAAANPPYNHHLVTDAGAGFLAIGALLVLAMLWRERRLIQAALISSLVHDVPHFWFHLSHPATSLSAGERIASTGGLAIACAVAGALLVMISSTSADRMVA